MLDRTDVRIFWQSLRAWGPREAVIDFTHYYRAKRHERADRFDERFGTETSRMVGIGSLDGLGANGADAIHYWPTRECEFTATLDALGDLDHSGFTFVDLGCGKGRVVLLAAAHPFRRAVGVDFSPALVEVARENVTRYTGPVRARAVEFEACDAAEWVVPDGDLVIYMFNPFGPQVLTRVLANLVSAVQAQPRTLYLLYYSPEYPELVLEAGFRSLVEGSGQNWGWAVYTWD
ncbi:class I SAM-dependent methyltransferase [Actinokineospora terrae]|uniref:Methyltransferase domain-containing protein n=1 Tax=Actinokineospora terrae TaxID=155974 RepID=A0A1H9KUD8_9PSEU|nr:class I SAM-dependent methyltransferase [Actinokineospora terrae]SER02507.1 Methyltransferase domain-containing protein [Actinokineospora terrae]